MLTAEYDYELDIEVQREEAFANGKELGKNNGVRNQDSRKEGQLAKNRELRKEKKKSTNCIPNLKNLIEMKIFWRWQ